MEQWRAFLFLHCLKLELQAAAAMLSAAMRNDSAPHAPYLRTLPARDGVWSYYDLPASYLPLLYNDAMVSTACALQVPRPANLLGPVCSRQGSSAEAQCMLLLR